MNNAIQPKHLHFQPINYRSYENTRGGVIMVKHLTITYLIVT